MIAVHLLYTAGMQSQGKKENPEYGAKEFQTGAREIV